MPNVSRNDGRDKAHSDARIAPYEDDQWPEDEDEGRPVARGRLVYLDRDLGYDATYTLESLESMARVEMGSCLGHDDRFMD